MSGLGGHLKHLWFARGQRSSRFCCVKLPLSLEPSRYLFSDIGLARERIRKSFILMMPQCVSLINEELPQSPYHSPPQALHTRCTVEGLGFPEL